MNHAQKVALVPYEQVRNTCLAQEPTKEPAKDVPRDFLKDRISALDSKMKEILEDTSMSVEQKVIQYNQVLEEYLLFADKFYEREEGKRQLITHTQGQNEDIEEQSEDKTLIASLPPLYQKRGTTLFNRIKEAGADWDRNGTLFINGKPIEDSNIQELLHFVLRHRRKNVSLPKGNEPFKQLLADSKANSLETSI